MRSPSQPVTAGVVTALVGCTSAFAVVLAGWRAVGATPAQAASGLLGLTVVMGTATIQLALGTRLPITVAWIEAAAGLALVATCATALRRAFSAGENAVAPAVTLLVTVSGVQVGGIGSAFGGVLAGLAVLLVVRRTARPSRHVTHLGPEVAEHRDGHLTFEASRP